MYISTDHLRENMKNGTALGTQARPFLDAGKSVPGDFLVDFVKDRLNQPDLEQKECLLDSFPQTPDHAQARVNAKLRVHKFILSEVRDDTLVERGVGRRLGPVANTKGGLLDGFPWAGCRQVGARRLLGRFRE